MNILADATLPNLSQRFPEPFKLTTYNSHPELKALLPNHEVLICRSTLRVNEALLAGSQIQCVATASSGTDHIDHHYLKSQNIRLFDANGSNAHAVADYVTSTLAWLNVHLNITGQHAGLIGAGAVGTQVLKRLTSAGYDVSIYDPYKTSTSSFTHVHSLQALSECDVLCIHPNLHHCAPYPSYHLINADFLSMLKPGVTLINASRGGVVNEADLLQTQQRIHYCTDVFMDEPDINPAIVNFATLCTPHIAGHSIEAKQDAIIQLSEQLHAYVNRPPTIRLHSTVHIVPNFMNMTDWKKRALSLYNPYEDTQILKATFDKKTAFLTQRSAHIHRHHFCDAKISSKSYDLMNT